jgi:DNA-binding HxlR family transcriptional regulator
LILRECFPRKRRFEAFEASLGITCHVLADRLKKLMRRIPYQESPKRYEYILTKSRRLSDYHLDRRLGQYPHG